MNIAPEAILAKLPIEAIRQTIHQYARPLAKKLPDKRLGRGVDDLILGILGGESPVVTEIARHQTMLSLQRGPSKIAICSPGWNAPI